MEIPFLKNRKVFIIALIISATLAIAATSDAYFELNKNLDLFSSLYKELNTNYVDEIDPDKMIGSGIDAMLASLDPYTNYITEDELANYKFQTTGKYGGIGASVRDMGDYIIIAEPYEGFPANKAGLQAGDFIIAIDGKSCKDKSIDDISKLLKGIAGSSFKMTVRRPGVKDDFIKELKREEVAIKSVAYAGMMTPTIGYIRFTQFTDNGAKDIIANFNQLKASNPAMNGFILDLRGNPGGLLNEAVAISNIFIKKGEEVVSTRGRVSEWDKVYRTAQEATDANIPLVILTSRGSASASEIVSGTLQDLDRAVVIGQRTFGKGLVQTTRPLAFNCKIKITTAKYYIPSGRCIQALDYTHRNADGSVGKIPDSLKHPFKTKMGRVVYDGGGIDPDIKTEAREYSPLELVLLNKSYLVDFATQYHLTHSQIVNAKDFAISDADFEAFVTYLSDKTYTYQTESEKHLETLKKTAESENYFGAIANEYETLKTKLIHDKKDDLYRSKESLKELLSTEIASRYYLQKGRFESAFKFDKDIQKAIELLNNPSAYQAVFQKK
jgi:carboxyl-terminal processing protease